MLVEDAFVLVLLIDVNELNVPVAAPNKSVEKIDA